MSADSGGRVAADYHGTGLYHGGAYGHNRGYYGYYGGVCTPIQVTLGLCNPYGY